MNLQHYNNTCYKLSKVITDEYSTSFSLGIKAFAPEYRNPIYAIYGFVRVADEIVDTFHQFNKKELLEKFREDTFTAIDDKISTNPVLNSFQEVVHNYGIGLDLIDAFLTSMEMDLHESSYNRVNYDEYIYGSAEVVGLMCLNVFVNGDIKKYDELKPYAKSLGSAFQKVNFLRDINSDLKDRGRIYIPNVHNSVYINNTTKKQLEEEVEKEFSHALTGIRKLPIGVKLGVYLAFVYYLQLFKKIKLLDVKDLFKERVRVSNFQKFGLFIKSFFEVKIQKLS